MMSIAGIMVYFEGKEFYRANGLVALGELKEKIGRYYGMMLG